MYMLMSIVRNFFYYMFQPILMLAYAPYRMLSAPKKLLGCSVPTRVAILVAIFLVLCVVAVIVAYFYDATLVPWTNAWTPGRIVAIIALVIFIPFVVHKALSLWLEGEASRFPDIDYAWSAGLEELERNGLRLDQVPVFIVLGTNGELFEKALFDASRLSLRVREVPQGPAAIHWYANPDGIYIVCTQTSCLSKLSDLAKHAAEDDGSSMAAPARGGRGDNLRGTVVVGDAGGPDDIRGTSTVGDSRGRARGGDVRGTMNLGGTMDLSGVVSSPEAPSARGNVTLKPQDTNEQVARLEYVCRLLRRARQPLCPVNGILTLLPFGIMEAGAQGGRQLQLAVKADLTAVGRKLQIRCPVLACVVGLEEESGFRELVRRVGRKRAVHQRFGKGSHIWSMPSSKQLDAVCAHACGAFEDWVYSLFREPEALSKPGNTKLYYLLCKIRRHLRQRLTNVLITGYGVDDKSATQAEPFLFGGCYFASAGETEDRQSFVKSIFEKLLDSEEDLEWTEAAMASNERYVRFAYIGVAIDILLAVSLAAMIIYKIAA